MSYPIDKKAVYSARYPHGTIIELTEPIQDPYSPKPVGSTGGMVATAVW